MVEFEQQQTKDMPTRLGDLNFVLPFANFAPNNVRA